jgi:hypothetical protein
MVNTKFAPNLNKNYDFPLSKKIVKTEPVVATIKLLNRNDNKNTKYLSVLNDLVSKSQNNELNLQLGGLYENAKVLSSMPVIAKFNDILLNIYSNQQIGGSSSRSSSPSRSRSSSVDSTDSKKEVVVESSSKPITQESSSKPITQESSRSRSSSVDSTDSKKEVVNKSKPQETVSQQVSQSSLPVVSAEENTKINGLVSNTIGNISYGETLSILKKYVKK